jgi:Uma2 family endonuclease
MHARRVVTTFTPAEYLAMERVSEQKHEYVAGEILAMAGGTRLHSATCQEAGRVLGNALAGKGCTVFQSDMRLAVSEAGPFFYPDVQVVCGEATGPDDTTIDNPTVVIEVLSESTADFDRGEKTVHYRRVASLRDIVLVDPIAKRVEHWARGDDGTWTYADGPAEVKLAGCDVAVPVGAFFPSFSALPR